MVAKTAQPGGGDNLFLSSIVAVNADTGEYVWHYQEVPSENWDFTAVQQMTLADLTLNGERRKVLLHAPKNGFFYVIDRVTGKLISANNYVPVNWASHVDLATGRPVERPENLYDDRQAQTIWPAHFGAHNWQPMSYSPLTGLVYIPAQETSLFACDGADSPAHGLECALSTRTRSRSGAPAPPAQGLPCLRGSCEAEGSLARRARGRVEWRHAQYRGKSRVPRCC